MLAVGAATGDAPTRIKAHAPAASKSTPQVLPSDLPAWAAARAAASRGAKSRIVFPDANGRNVNSEDAPLVEGIGSLNKRRAATILLIPGEAAHQNEMMSPAVTE
jgi:hypothetical protein